MCKGMDPPPCDNASGTNDVVPSFEDGERQSETYPFVRRCGCVFVCVYVCAYVYSVSRKKTNSTPG